MKWVGAILVFLVAGCGSGSNTQKEPIGSRCNSNGNCGTSPFQCETAANGYPGGYCDKPCTTDGDCPLDSLCLPKPAAVCRRRCTDSAECRTDTADGKGYACITTEGATGSYCDVQTLTTPVDLGPVDL